MGDGEDDAEERRQRRRVRVEAIALYTELTVTYKQLKDHGHDDEAGVLLPEIERLRGVLAGLFVDER